MSAQSEKKNYAKGTKKLPDLRKEDIVRMKHNGETPAHKVTAH